MANRNNVNESVIERRLKPIYDWLDNGNNKKAVQEADKVLRKQTKLHCATVLKALALLRLGRSSECTTLIDSVVSEGTSDDATLQALTIYFREIHELDMICLVYEKAAKLDPSNEEILSHLFMSYVRMGNYKKQQQTALQLYKLKQKNPYYFWGVMSIVMQAHSSNEESTQKISLQLAERMILKFVNENKIDSEAEVLTYLYVLEIQNKYQEALEIIEGPLTKKITQQPGNFVLIKRGNYLSKLERFDAASDAYAKLIRLEEDNWQHYVNYIDNYLASAELTQQEEKEPFLAKASNYLKTLQNKALKQLQDHSSCFRSPLLGLLQLALKMKEKGWGDLVEKICGNVPQLVQSYVQMFGDKMCCFSDLINFLPLIGADEAPTFLNNVKAYARFDDNNVPIDVKNIYRHQLFLQLRNFFRLTDQDVPETDRKLPPETDRKLPPEIEFADRLFTLYEKTKHLSKDMAPTDIQPNDAYLILAAHVYMSVIDRMTKAEMLVVQERQGHQDKVQGHQGQNIDRGQGHQGQDKGQGHQGQNNDRGQGHQGQYKGQGHQGQDKGQGHQNQGQGLPLRSSDLIVKLCSVLENGSEISKANFQLKLLLIKAYCRIGAFDCAFKVYEQLDLKQIQFDTLGYVLPLHLADSGAFAIASPLLSFTLRFFMGNYKDTSEPLLMSYKFGSLTRIPEFTEFRERLSKSLHFATVTTEVMILDLTTRATNRSELSSMMKYMEIDPYRDKTENWDTLRDNRDLTVMISWDPPPLRFNENLKHETFEADKLMLRMRETILRLIGAAYDWRKTCDTTTKFVDTDKSGLSNGVCNGVQDVTSSLTALKSMTSQLRNLQNVCDKYKLEEIPEFPLQGPDPPRIYLYSKGLYIDTILKHANILIQLQEESSDKSSLRFEDLAKSVSPFLEFHLNQLETFNLSTSDIVPEFNRRSLFYMSHFLQTLSLLLVLVDCCYCVFEPVRAKLNKKHKKKKSSSAPCPDLPSNIQDYNLYITTVTDHLILMDTSATEKLIGLKSLSTMHIHDRPETGDDSPVYDLKGVRENVGKSLEKSLNEFHLCLKTKLEFFSSLKIR